MRAHTTSRFPRRISTGRCGSIPRGSACVAAFWGEGAGRAALLDIGDGSHIELFANGTAQHSQNERFVHFAIRTADPDKAFAAALAAGAREKTPPTTVSIPADPPLPARIAFVLGPDDEVLEFFQAL